MIDDSPRCYSMYAIHYTNWQYIYPIDCYTQNSFTAPKWPRQPLRITGLARPVFEIMLTVNFQLPNYVRSLVSLQRKAFRESARQNRDKKGWLQQRLKNRMSKSILELVVSALLRNDRSNFAERRRKVGPKSQPCLLTKTHAYTRIKATLLIDRKHWSPESR